ncbi:DMBT1 protein, partial [Haliaeetus albicilla]|nr:DMBT1 protein [Haliaeetus albicilla]
RCAGRVEVKQQGQWGTVCGGYFWEMRDAAVVCKQLGCGSALEAHEEAHFGPGSGPIWMFGVECDGTESALSDCTNTEWVREYCDHRWDAGVTCSGKGPAHSLPLMPCSPVPPMAVASLLSPGSAGFASLRLVGGGSRCDGRVEIFQNGTWGRVLDNQWDVQEASVVCRQLRCG